MSNRVTPSGPVELLIELKLWADLPDRQEAGSPNVVGAVALGQPGTLGDRLLRREPVSMPGAVRLSMGLATNRADIAALVEAVETIATDGPRWTYRSAPDGSNSWPFPDTRPRPTFPFELAP